MEVELFYSECDTCQLYLWTEDGWILTNNVPKQNDHVVMKIAGEEAEYLVKPDLTRSIITKKSLQLWGGLSPEDFMVTLVAPDELLAHRLG